MLKKLKVKNFKSLKDFEIELGKFNVLIGKNNSGKSNIMDVLSFLSEGFKDSSAEKIFIRRGGYKEVVFGGNEENDIEITNDFELEIDDKIVSFEYYLKISGKYDKIKVVEEKLKIKEDNTSPQVIEKEDLEQLRTISSFSKYELDKIFSYSPRGNMIKKMLPNFSLLRNQIYQIYFYKIIPHNIKSEHPEAFIPGDLNLDEECKNLALFLLKLSQQDKIKFERINELLSGVIDEIEYISPQVLGKNVYLMMKDRNFDKYFYPGSISDGTISLLCYITIIETAEKNSIICFEEPENYIHPRLLEFIVDLMKKSKAQIIVTTHSLSFIDLCNPEDIIIVEKEEGKTKARGIRDHKKLKEKLDEIGITLGEEYFSSELKNEYRHSS